MNMNPRHIEITDNGYTLPTDFVRIGTATKYRCSNGHEWVETTFSIHDQRVSVGEKTFCMQCIVEFMERHIGQVEEVTDGSANHNQ